MDDAMSRINKLTADDYAGAFEQIREHMPESDLLLLSSHLQAPNHDVTAAQLARLVGFARFQAANLRYGTLAGRLLEFFQIRLERRINLNILATFEYRDDEWHWILRPEVVDALTRLTWL